MIGTILYLAILIAALVGMWKMFEKAGQPGWGCIIPIYNLYLLTKIAEKPWWWIIMFIIPGLDLPSVCSCCPASFSRF